MQVKYRDLILDIKKGTKIKDIFAKQIKESEMDILACKFNNEIKSLNFEIQTDGIVELIDITNKDGMRIYRRGLLYIVSKAINELYPKTYFSINYQLYHAMFCTFDNEEPTEEMIKNINKRVSEIVEKDLLIQKKSMTKEEAKKFYSEKDSVRGILQFYADEKDTVSLDCCEDYYNYFYGVLPISTGVLKKYEIKKYKNGFLIRYPSRKNPTHLPAFIETPKLFEALNEYENLHKVLKIDTVHRLNRIIKSSKIKEYILLDEALHEKKIAGIADQIAKNSKTKLVVIAGPSSSGKTTFSKRLETQLRINGIKPITISVDNYFVERDQTPLDENGEYDFECIEAIDTELLNNDLKKLLAGEEILMPTFNFYEGKKEYTGKTMRLAKDEVLIMEGIHCLNDNLTYLIPREQKFKIYLSALTVLNIDFHNSISTTDTRLIRRIVRDNRSRGYDAEHTLSMWPKVNEGEKNNIFTFQETSDAMFNSSLIYELSVLKKYVVPLLKEIKPSSEYYSEAKRLYSLLKYFEPIDDKLVPDSSLLREFIGGSIFE